MTTLARDKFGEYQMLTGNEDTGVCWWCAGPFPDKRHRRYCSEVCSVNYGRHFYWPGARRWAMERALYRCQDCGVSHKGMSLTHHYYYKGERWPYEHVLEVHHLEARNGAGYGGGSYNHLPFNLVCLCVICHDKRHTNPKVEKPKIDLWVEAAKEGQLVMALMK